MSERGTVFYLIQTRSNWLGFINWTSNWLVLFSSGATSAS